MAQQICHVCSACAHAIEAWDEGEPYVVDPDGSKRYVYHPHPDRARAVGVDHPRLCLACAAEFLADEAQTSCTACGSRDTVDSYRLAGHPCPVCRTGTFGPPHWTGTIS